MGSEIPAPFITFEGPDGSGKSTQASKLSKWLRGRGINTVLTFEPGDTPLGKLIRDTLLHGSFDLDPITELLLYLADRREHVAKVIKPALDSGYFVICDRFIDSTIAYQGFGRGIDMDIIKTLNNFVIENAYPSLTFFLDLPPSESLLRIDTADNTEVLGDDFYSRVSEGYSSLAETYPDRFVIIDIATIGGINEVFEYIINRVTETWPFLLENDSDLLYKE